MLRVRGWVVRNLRHGGYLRSNLLGGLQWTPRVDDAWRFPVRSSAIAVVTASNDHTEPVEYVKLSEDTSDTGGEG